MTIHIQKLIEQLGFKPNEAKVYLAALGLGESHITDIALKAKLPRTTTQAIVDKLHKEGLMNFYVRRRYKYWVAENPERLLINFKKREEAMRSAIPELTALRAERRGKRGKASQAESGFFRILADASTPPVLIATDRAEIVYVNVAWEKQFGYLLDEIIGENPRIFQSGKTPREIYGKMWEALKAERMFQSDEVIDKRKDGSLFHLLTTIFPVRHKGNLYYVQVLDDITNKKRVEALRKRFVANNA